MSFSPHGMTNLFFFLDGGNDKSVGKSFVVKFIPLKK
jgi:hypothetical protein